MYKIIHIDLETENHPWYGQVASPFCPENYIVAPGWRIDTVDDAGTVHTGTVHDRYFHSKEEADAGADWFDMVADPAVMIITAHNAQFEIKWWLSKYRKVFEDFIKRGGRVACTAMAQYLISHQQELYPSLDETAVQYGGTHKVDGVKILWEQGALTSEIDKALLLEYLSGPNGDIENTAISFYGQQAKLAEQGMTTMYWERCDSLLAFAYCEWFGLYVDRDVAEKNRQAQEAEIAELQKELYKLLPDDLPAELEFNWGSDYHMSALVYGGPVKYRHKVPYDPVQYVKYDAYLVDVNGTEQYIDIADVPNPSEYRWPVYRYKSGKNKGQAKIFRIDSDEIKLKWQDTSVILPGLVNVNTLPAGVKEKYVGKRAEFRGAYVLCDGVTPVYSTSTDALKGLKNFVPTVGLMVKLAGLEKDTGTYYLREELDADGNVKKVKGMMQYIGPDSIVHHSLNVTATVTTRLSSSNPNLQNLPRDGTSNVKEMFTSRFGYNGRIVEVDYSALEVVMLCAMTKDMDLLALLQNNTDMHCYRLAFKLGEPYEDVLEKCKNEDHPEHKKYSAMRTDIKPLSFADQYGATAEGIAFNTGCSVEFAKEFQENEMKLFPTSRGFRQVIIDEVKSTGSLPNGIHREMSDIGTWRVYRRGYYQAPSTTRYSFRQHDSWDKESRQTVMKYKPTQMANYPFQGEAGFMMSTSMGRICRWLIHNNWFGGNVCLINNVHDAVYGCCKDDEYARVFAKGAKEIMENAPRYMTALWPEYDMAEVPFPAAAECGPNMQHKSHMELNEDYPDWVKRPVLI
ncbi:DNA polymerase [Pectobacterium phage Koot]|uniref:DNA polymerase I n=3 Tax=Phimunavirus koot TaxID=2733341 RepID=A0A3G8FLA6_9CAUD|nr:DNA polymerase [Pectobacterium phage Koot]AXY81902.1 DNA polymerase I [Pectobacterium phage Momine]AZF94610.1 DNA polymerase I [Pectobacterium phage Koot]AZF94662.1 DNA polymerase I [Pectobacterium phage Koot_B1]